MDVEGEEMWSLPQMVKSRAFINVQQVHMEVIIARLVVFCLFQSFNHMYDRFER